MTVDLCISIRFLHPFPLYHGRRDDEQPEWPPSPMRLLQALLNAACLRTRGRPLPPEVRRAFERLEGSSPRIIAPRAYVSTVGYRAYVPHNQADLVASAWHRGNLDESIAEHRIEKDVRPIRVDTSGDQLPALHYLYPLGDSSLDMEELLSIIRPCVRAVTHLGWGIDQVAGDAALVDSSRDHLTGERWSPSRSSGVRLRLHRSGSLDALIGRYGQFLDRLRDGEWTPAAPLSAFELTSYRRDCDPIGRPYAVFKLLDSNDDTYTQPHAKLIHLAGMVRHLAIAMMSKHPPRGVAEPARWVERYVAGHRGRNDATAEAPHTQLSYVPLPSIGHAHTDPGVRRVMIIAPIGDESLLDHVAQQLDGRLLEPERPEHLRGPVFLSRVRTDGVIDRYTNYSRTWASFTPVILPGHDDREPAKTVKLIHKALIQSGVDQPCEFEWSAHSHFAKSYGAHKHVRDEQARNGRRSVGYVRPDHLLDLSVVHLKVTFKEPVPGPITIGAGRHCGFGLMASIDATSTV